MPAIEIDTGQWPICFIRIDGDQTLEDYERYIATFDGFYARQQPFAVVTQLKRYGTNREIVARTGRWFKETEPLIKKYWVSNAMVSQSTSFRFILSAVFLVKPLPIPYLVAATTDEALSFTRKHWSGRGLPTLDSSLRWPFAD
jgi:hypothetical protein